MTVADLIEGLPVALARGGGRAGVRAIVEDSRCVTPGCIFVARPGADCDGRQFIGDAVAAGAVAVVCDEPNLVPRGTQALVAEDVPLAAALLAERFWGHPSRDLLLIGITGTNGKTTTAHFVHQMLNGAGIRCGLIGTILTDDGSSVATSDLTTPPAMELSGLLRSMVDAGCRACVMEVSSHALDQRRPAGLHFDIAVFTNLSGDHLDYHGDMTAYLDAKARLFESLRPENRAVVNVDDPAATKLRRRCAARTITTSLSERSADCRAEMLGQGLSFIDARVRGPWGTLPLRVRLTGGHNLANALQAAAVAHAAGLSREAIREGLIGCVPPPGRLEPVAGPGDDVTALVDYAHSDDALDHALHAIREVLPPGARLHVVFGCGGDRDRSKRPRMAHAACRWADHVVVTSDNPRTEDPQQIVDDILEGVPRNQEGQTRAIVDRKEAIEATIAGARPGDVVLIAGKGHEDYQIVGHTKRPFDDRTVARAALEHRRAEVVAS